MFRRMALAVAATLVIVAGHAVAQPSPYGAGEPGADPSLTPAEQARIEAWREAAEYEKATGYKQPEKLLDRPSGFWTSTRPARGGAYRWRIMAAGILVLGVTVFFVLRLLRRTSQARA
jgi:hypothetical protein